MSTQPPLPAEEITRLAGLLFEAERTRTAVPPLSEAFPGGWNIDDAYRIQLANVKRAEGLGHRVSGKKIGLTSAGIQQQLGVDEPDYGHLFKAMDCPDGRVDTAALIQPKIEAELAFVLAEDLSGGHVTPEEVLAKTAYVAGAFEIVDSRVADWRITLFDTVADNASSGRYVLGEVHVPPKEVDLPAVHMQLFKNGEQLAEGEGAAVLGHPAKAVAWLANRLYGYGVPFKKGEVILSGAFSAAPLAQKGDVFEAVFSHFGSVKAAFV